jgi:hypothetical protein
MFNQIGNRLSHIANPESTHDGSCRRDHHPARMLSLHHDLQGAEALNIKHDEDAIDCRIQ